MGAVRDALRGHLAKHGVETRNYFFPLHLEPVNFYSGDVGVYDIVLSNAERAAQVGLYLPTHSFMELADVIFICDLILCFFKSSLPTPVPPRSLGWVNVERTKL